MDRNCVVKYGELQEKVRRKGGTLLRKKKYVFEEERWVALCVHDNKIPFLEWYSCQERVAGHEPLRVQDLLECMMVNAVIGDDRCFIIGFSDETRPILEFSAPTSQQCSDWVDVIATTLQRLKCLGECENIYSELPVRELKIENVGNQRSRRSEPSISPPPLPAPEAVASPSFVRNRTLCLTDQIPMQTATNTNLEMEEMGSMQTSFEQPTARPFTPLSSTPLKVPMKFQHPTRGSSEFAEPTDDAVIPPLPPRKSDSLSTSPHSSRNSVYCTSPKNVQDSQYDFPHSPPPNYDVLSVKNTPIYSLLSFDGKSQVDMESCGERIVNSPACKIRPHPIEAGVSSPESRTSIESQRSNAEELVQQSNMYMEMVPQSHHNPSRLQYDFPTSSPPVIRDPFDNFKEALSKPKTISLLLTICVEHIAFVEAGSRIWIAGWSPEKDNYLRNVIHFGDEVVQIGKMPVRSIQQVLNLFFTQALPGTPIELTIRSIPHGSVYSIKKPLNPKKSLGIVLHKKKNMIASVEERSEADLAKVPSKVTPYVYGSTEVSAVITELDGIPLNPFAKNEALFHRLERLTQGAAFSIIIQPRDLVKLIKQQLKLHKNYKKLIHDF